MCLYAHMNAQVWVGTKSKRIIKHLFCQYNIYNSIELKNNVRIISKFIFFSNWIHNDIRHFYHFIFQIELIKYQIRSREQSSKFEKLIQTSNSYFEVELRAR